MAMIPFDVTLAASSASSSSSTSSFKKRRTEKSNVQPKSLMQQKLAQVLLNLMGTFLTDSELKNLRNTAGFLRYTSEKDIIKRKIKRGLLPHIFGANPSGIESFFIRENAKPGVLLIRTDFREGYISQKNKKPEFVCFRKWRNVSALQAVAFCGDVFLLHSLLKRIVHHAKYRVEAIKQLDEVTKRITDQTLLLNSVVAIIEAGIEDGRSLRADFVIRFETLEQTEEFQQIIAGQKIENTENRYADDAEFLDPVLKLIRAYINFIIQYPKLFAENDIATLAKLWGIVGECQKELPHYIKQEYFTHRGFSIPPTSFSDQPNRGPCCCWGEPPLNLDDLGVSFLSLCKGRHSITPRLDGACPFPGIAISLVSVLVDLANFAHLYKLRRDGLINIIETLKKELACPLPKDGKRISFTT